MIDFSTQGAFRARQSIILASASPRRQALLCSLGIHFEVIPAQAKEPSPDKGEMPVDYARRMAVFKTQEVADKRPEAVVIGADTIVVQESVILRKPHSKKDALDMLQGLCGTTHEVITGYCVMQKQENRFVRASVCTQVDMSRQEREILDAYVATGESLDKAGSYAIQGMGSFLIREIRGSYTNVVGLPLSHVLKVLLDWEAVRICEQ